MIHVYEPPESTSNSLIYPNRIFLAGSIEMGAAAEWQSEFMQELETKITNDDRYCFYNPRRASWDSSWDQNFEAPQFNQQVNWELNNLEKATHILMYFDPNTKSIISMLELGLFARSNKLIVVCPEGYCKKGNVDIVCDRYKILQLDSLETAALHIANETTI